MGAALTQLFLTIPPPLMAFMDSVEGREKKTHFQSSPSFPQQCADTRKLRWLCSKSIQERQESTNRKSLQVCADGHLKFLHASSFGGAAEKSWTLPFSNLRIKAMSHISFYVFVSVVKFCYCLCLHARHKREFTWSMPECWHWRGCQVFQLTNSMYKVCGWMPPLTCFTKLKHIHLTDFSGPSRQVDFTHWSICSL